MQSLTDFTDTEIKEFTRKTKDKLKNITRDIQTMLRTLGADEESERSYNKALSLYPELLRDGYSKETLKDIKKRMLYDARSGAIKCKNKRLFAIPDLYAACQFWFMGQTEPEGLLKNGEVAARIFRQTDKLDILRSPSLYMEHSVRTVSHDPTIYNWFISNGIYTSCHDLISRILQFDCDGDQLNCVSEQVIINAAERNISEHSIIPLFYDANKASPEQLSRDAMFNGLKRAHDYSGIGQISNSLTKLWNSDAPDYISAAMLCMYNNLTIDAAKSGVLNSYEKYPEINKRISKAIGGKAGRMPHFFQYSKNGRKETKKKAYAKPNNSTMNRICNSFGDTYRINFNYQNLPLLNWQMLIDSDTNEVNKDAIEIFCSIDNTNISNFIESNQHTDMADKANTIGYDILAETIIGELNKQGWSIEDAYPSIVKYLFAGENAEKASHKRMFWRVFGEIAVNNIIKNMNNCTICSKCGMKIPNWTSAHKCEIDGKKTFVCVDCGNVFDKIAPKQCRCTECQAEHRRIYTKNRNKRVRKERKEERCGFLAS